MTRYFPNDIPDLASGLHVPIDRAHWVKSIEDTAENIIKGMPPIFDNCDGGLYVGCAGVAYMFYYLANSEPLSHRRDEYLTKARNYMDVALSYALSKRNRDPAPAFLLGSAGVFAVGALLYHDIGQTDSSKELLGKYQSLAAACQPVDYLGQGSDELFITCKVYSRTGQTDSSKELLGKYQSLAAACQPVDYLGQGSDELFVGRAGYLCGALLLNRKFGKAVSQASLHKLCHATIHSGREYARKHKSASPLMYAYYDTEYLGAAHGLSAILQMLLHFPEYVRSDPLIEQDVRGATDYMLGLVQPNGNIVAACDEVSERRRRPPDQELVHWCHGGPGVIYLFARAHRFWKDDKYLRVCLKIGELVWQKGLLKKGPGICHGVAGSGYVFLLLYRMTADEKHLHRAVKFAEFMQTRQFQEHARAPDSPFSLYEGLAGTMCFLADMLQPRKAEFPFFDVLS